MKNVERHPLSPIEENLGSQGHVVLVSTSELILKSQYVRSTLQKSLLKDLAWKLRQNHEEASINVENGRVVVSNINNPTAAARLCAEVFGVSLSCDAIVLPTEKRLLVEGVSTLARQKLIPGDTFAVRARVVGTHAFHSKDIEIEVGKDILDHTQRDAIKVNLDKPNKTIFVEARERHTYAYTDRNRGVGGIPYGTQGRLVCMLSGGIDSPVAAWLMMKRGIHVIPIFMDMGSFASEDYKMKAIKVVKRLREFAPVDTFKMLIAPFEKVARTIASVTETRFRCVLCKRMMYRIACLSALDKNSLGVVTGESVGQVASQTLRNISILTEAAKMPLYRPLIGMDKEEIQTLARKIGTYNISIQKAQGCSLVPSKPATRALIEAVNKIEETLDVTTLANEAFAEIENIAI